MKVTLLAIAAVCALPAPATAHMLQHRDHQTASQELRYAQATTRHAARVIHWARWDLRWVHINRRRTVDSFDPDLASTWGNHVRVVRARLRAHRWLLRLGKRLERDAWARMLPAHYSGWLCIHNREGSWNDQGAPYYGGLQMSYGWMGLVSNAAQLSPLQQMTAAERGYRNSGYSDAWMRGQWPLTYPPCAHLF